ncbi:MAG: hypothetical protein V1827_04275 [Candidatus Micrarchaeota archaeon]
MHMLCAGDIVAGSEALPGSSLYLWGYAGMAGVALMASSAILAFMYVWGTLFRNPQLMAYVKTEVSEVIVTAFMIIFIYGAVGAMGTLTMGSFLPDEYLPDAGTPGTEECDVAVNIDTSLYDAAQMFYLRVEKDMSGWLQMNYVMNIYVDQTASITPYARPLGVGLVASPLAGLASPIKQLLYNASVALSLAFIINHAQMVVYVYSIHAFLKYYLPLGIMLRAFTPTRRIGGTIIGVALAFLFIFPMMSAVSYTMFYTKAGGPLVTFSGTMAQYMGDSCDPETAAPGEICFSGYLDRMYKKNFSDIGSGVGGLVTGVFGGIGKMFQEVLGNVFLALLVFPVSMISWAFAVGFIIPAINIMVFTMAAKSLSKSFGDEVDISSLTRLI